MMCPIRARKIELTTNFTSMIIMTHAHTHTHPLSQGHLRALICKSEPDQNYQLTW